MAKQDELWKNHLQSLGLLEMEKLTERTGYRLSVANSHTFDLEPIGNAQKEVKPVGARIVTPSRIICYWIEDVEKAATFLKEVAAKNAELRRQRHIEEMCEYALHWFDGMSQPSMETLWQFLLEVTEDDELSEKEARTYFAEKYGWQ